MDERLTWEEIVERYPDEWVILTDIDEDRTDSFVVAHVFDHGADRDRVEDRTRAMREPFGIFSTGQMAELPLALWLGRPASYQANVSSGCERGQSAPMGWRSRSSWRSTPERRARC